MLLEVPVADLIAKLDRDGSEILWSNIDPMLARRGFHEQELFDVILEQYGQIIAHVHIQPGFKPWVGSLPEKLVWTNEQALKRLEKYMESFQGVLTGCLPPFNAGHAVACRGSTIYDPNGKTYSIHEMELQIQSFYFLVEHVI